MRKVLTGTLLLTGIFGFAGILSAGGPPPNVLDAPGFEDCAGNDLESPSWTHADSRCKDGAPKIGNYAAQMHLGDDEEGSVSQDVILDCSPHNLAKWEAASWYNLGADGETARLTVSLDDSGSTEATVTGTNYVNGDFDAVWMSGTVPYDATTATVTGSGEDGDGDGNDRANVRLDDMYFGYDCAMDYTKISGKWKFGPGCGENCGAYKRGLVSLSGAWGHVYDEFIGAMEVNYKFAKTVCTYLPVQGSNIYLDDQLGPGQDASGAASTYTCVGDAPGAGDAVWAFFEGEGGSNKGGAKDRGCFQIIHTSGGAPIPVFDHCLIGETLDNGNVDIDSDTSD